MDIVIFNKTIVSNIIITIIIKHPLGGWLNSFLDSVVPAKMKQKYIVLNGEIVFLAGCKRTAK